MILIALIAVLVMAWLVSHLVLKGQCRQLFATDDRVAARPIVVRAHTCAIVRNAFMVASLIGIGAIIIVNNDASVKQIRDQQQIRRYEATIKIRMEQAESLCAEFSVLLGKTYPKHEKKIFGMITPENIDVYWAQYPEIKANKTAVALVEKINALKGAYYDLRQERETVLRQLRYRSENPWLISFIVGEPLREAGVFGFWMLFVVLGLSAIALARVGRKGQAKFWQKIYKLGVQENVCSGGGAPQSPDSIGVGWWVYGFFCGVVTAVFVLVGLINTVDSWSSQIFDKHQVVQIERQMGIAKEKADVLSAEFKRILVTDYQIHESEIFSSLVPKDVRVYLARYPQIRLADTVIELVGQMNSLWAEYYDKQIEREAVIAELRYRPRSPMLIQSLVPSAERMLEEAVLDVDSSATIQDKE